MSIERGQGGWRGFTIHPFGRGALTATGIQYSASADTNIVNTNYNIEVVSINPPEPGLIHEVVFGLTAGINAISNATTGVKYTWQGRNLGVSWVDLHTQVTNVPGTTEIEKTVGGYFTPTTNFNSVPCELRLIVESNIADQGRARTKNSSYFTVIYQPK